jgi:hypothetical protein
MAQVHLHNRRILIQCEQLTAVHLCSLQQSAYRIADPVTYTRDVSSVREKHTSLFAALTIPFSTKKIPHSSSVFRVAIRSTMAQHPSIRS